MTRHQIVLVQLATRIPKRLHRQVKLHCVRSEISLMDFVVASLEEQLAHQSARGERRRARA